MQIILPKTLAHTADLVGRTVYFLAGPVRGAGDWQHTMALLLGQYDRDCVIAIPQRYGADHPLRRMHLLEGEVDAFPRQLAWEEHYLELASRNGGILFWLCCQKEARDDEDPYAMDTRREFGEWTTRASYDPSVRVLIGAEPGFRGLSQMERSAKRILGDTFAIHSSMMGLVRAAANV